MATRSAVRWVLIASLAAGWWAGSSAAEPPELPRMEVGVQGGFFLPDDDLSNKDNDLRELEPLGGLRFAVLFGRRFDWFIDSSFSDTNSNTPVGDVETLATRTGIDFYFRPHGKKVQWFVAVGGGVSDFDAEFLQDFDRNFLSAGVGQRVRLDRRANFRWELRADQDFDDNDIIEGQDITRAQFMISVNWGLGRADRDSDGDGVPDRRDACPDTPGCATVDERGCPSDSDEDGVYDGYDKCPGTPRCATVDEQGCPSDSDGDGVYDGCDKCPGTPRCATVDERGCPSDSDGDGVHDGCDKCPGTPRCATVDERGCPSDSDGDGVYDGCDKCPGTPPNTAVRDDGCAKEAPLFTTDKKKLILEGVFFEFDKAVLLPESRGTLDRVARSLVDWPEVRVEIEGHTDWDGAEGYNLDLSRRRAQVVKEYLENAGVAADRLEVMGYGESRPIADNNSAEGRSKNRRVELRKLD